MKNYLVLLAVAGAFTFSSCGSDDDDTGATPTPTPTPNPTKTELITNKNWKQTDQTRTANGATINTFGNVSSCERDDITKFSTNNTVTFDEGATKCDPNDPQSTSGTWSFTNNESKLKVGENGFDIEFNIVELTATKMSISMTENDTIFGTPVSVTENFIFTAQ